MRDRRGKGKMEGRDGGREGGKGRGEGGRWVGSRETERGLMSSMACSLLGRPMHHFPAPKIIHPIVHTVTTKQSCVSKDTVATLILFLKKRRRSAHLPQSSSLKAQQLP